jgi:hypothetical protein
MKEKQIKKQWEDRSRALVAKSFALALRLCDAML